MTECTVRPRFTKIPLEKFPEEITQYKHIQLISEDVLLPLTFRMDIIKVVFAPYIMPTMTLRGKDNHVVCLDCVTMIRRKRLTDGRVLYAVEIDNRIRPPFSAKYIVEIFCSK